MNRETQIKLASQADEGRAMVLDAIQTLDVALALWDEDLGFVFANDLWFEKFVPDRDVKPGDSGRDLLKRQVDEGLYVVPEGMGADDFVDQMMGLLQSYAKDVPVAFTDGTFVSASVHETGLTGYLISFRDNTEQMRSQREAEEQRASTEQANARLRDALESIGEGFALFDKDDRLILANDLYKSANPAAAHLMTPGRPRKEIIEAMTNGGDILGVDDWIDSYDRETDVGDTASPRRYEVHHADGRVFMASRGRTAEGGCTITWLDITDSKKTEARARAIANDAMESLDEGFALFDANLRFVFCNRMFADIVLGGQENTPEQDSDFVDHMGRFYDRKLSVDAATTPRQQYLDDARTFVTSYEKRAEFDFLDGRVLQMSSHQTGLGGYLITARDITAQIHARREIEQQRAAAEQANVRLRDALESIGEGFAFFDAEGELIMVNQAYKDASPSTAPLMTPGRPRDEIVEEMFSSGDILRQTEWIDQDITQTLVGNPSHPGRCEVHHSDGRIFLSSHARTAEGGRTVTWLDITDTKNTEARAQAIANDAMEALDEGFALFDAEMRFQFCNRNYMDVVLGGVLEFTPGMPVEEVVGAAFDSGIYQTPGLTREAYIAAMKEFARTYQKNAEFVRTDGRIFEASAHQTGLGGYLITARDVTEQRALEAERRRVAERELETVSETMQSLITAIALFDPEMNFVMGNAGYFDMWYHKAGVAPPDPGENMTSILDRLLAVDYFVLSDGVDSAAARSAMLESVETYAKNVPLATKSGSYIGNVSKAGNGGYLIEFLDVTEQLALEEERRESDARAIAKLTDTVQSLDFGLVLLDSDLNFVFCNQRHLDFYFRELPAPEVGEPMHSIMRRLVMNDFYDDPTEAEALIEKRLSIIRNATKGYEVRTKDGLILIGEVHRTADQGYLISLQDITEQRRAEEQALSKLTDTVQALDTGLILLDRDLKFVFGNERLMQIFHQEIAAPEVGEPMEEIALRLAEGGVFELPDGVSPERSVKRTMRLITNMERNVLVFIEGGRVFRCSVYPTKDDGRVIDFTDVTDQRQAEAELQRQREAAHQNEKLSAMGELLAGVAHELNNPLSIVVGYAMMMQNSVSDPKLRRQVDNVAQAAERCSRIVKAFLAMARQRPAELKRCSLNELMMAAVDMMGHRLRGAGIEVTMDLDPDLPDVEADEDQIIQVFTNLLVNAEQAVADRPEPRTLHLRSFMDHRAGKAVARIADNGPGIAKDVMPRIFEPFYTTKDVGTGTGIGLAFCHRVVTSHGGRMTVRSEPGRGARFYVRLALCEQQDDGPTIPAMSQNPGFGTVLVVDDEAGVAQLIGDVLGEAGYHVQIKNSAFDALELLKTQRFEAIISDIKMPGMDGPTFFEAITAIDPAMARRVGFVTGDTLSKSVAAFLSATEQPHLEKPVTPTELLGLVAGLVNIRSH